MVFVAGVAVLLAGPAMLALPGPGVLVIILGLVILATEFAWAERVVSGWRGNRGGGPSRS